MRAGYEIAPARIAEKDRSEATSASGLIGARERLRLDEIALLARVAVGTGIAGITALVGNEAHLIVASGMDDGVYHRGDSFCTFAIAEPSSLLCIPDARLDPRFAGNPHVTGEPWARFYAAATLMTPQGVAYGALCVIDPRPRTGLLAREAHMLLELAAEVMRRLETGRPD